MANVIAVIVVGLGDMAAEWQDLLLKGLHRDSETFPP